jgi:16S rRNA (uracil1498-N3)-methyltransferase
MRRFFVEHIQQPNLVYIEGTDARHIDRVLRLKQGDHIAVATGNGDEYDVVLEEIHTNMVKGIIAGMRESTNDPPLSVILIQGLPKGDKLELIIQKCTELGIAEIWPVHTERSVVKLAGPKAEERRERWQRIALEAAKQCRRQRVPLVKSIQSWQNALENMFDNYQGILLWESENTNSLKEALSGLTGDRPVYILVGPEGGLSEEEVHLAQAKGICTVTLGPRILRTETAGLAALSIIMYELGDLGSGRMACKK